MKLSSKSGATIATAAAELMLSGAVAVPATAIAAGQVQHFAVNPCSKSNVCSKSY